MLKRILFLLVTSYALLVTISFAQETLTITTYYPSPYGSYNQLQTRALGLGDNNDDGRIDSNDVADPATNEGDIWLTGNIRLRDTSRTTDNQILLFSKADIGSQYGYKFSWREDDEDLRLDALSLDRLGGVTVGKNNSPGSDNVTAFLGGSSLLFNSDFGINRYSFGAAIMGTNVSGDGIDDRRQQQAAIIGYNNYIEWPANWHSGIIGAGRNGVMGYSFGTGSYPGVGATVLGFGLVGLGSIHSGGGLYAAANGGPWSASLHGRVYIGSDSNGISALPTGGDLIVDGGRVGIGTGTVTWPEVPLDVVSSKDSVGIRYRKFGSRDARIQVGDSGRTWGLAVGWDTEGDFSIIEEGQRGDRLYIQKTTGNVGIGTTNPGGGSGGSILSLANSVGDPTPVSGVTHLFSQDGLGYWMDGAGNVTPQTPHDPKTGEWIFYSKNIKTGRVIRVNMEQLVHEVERLSGKQFMIETIETPED